MGRGYWNLLWPNWEGWRLRWLVRHGWQLRVGGWSEPSQLIEGWPAQCFSTNVPISCTGAWETPAIGKPLCPCGAVPTCAVGTENGGDGTRGTAVTMGTIGVGMEGAVIVVANGVGNENVVTAIAREVGTWGGGIGGGMGCYAIGGCVKDRWAVGNWAWSCWARSGVAVEPCEARFAGLGSMVGVARKSGSLGSALGWTLWRRELEVEYRLGLSDRALLIGLPNDETLSVSIVAYCKRQNGWWCPGTVNIDRYNKLIGQLLQICRY